MVNRISLACLIKIIYIQTLPFQTLRLFSLVFNSQIRYRNYNHKMVVYIQISFHSEKTLFINDGAHQKRQSRSAKRSTAVVSLSIGSLPNLQSARSQLSAWLSETTNLSVLINRLGIPKPLISHGIKAISLYFRAVYSTFRH